MLGLKLIRISERGPRYFDKPTNIIWGLNELYTDGLAHDCGNRNSKLPYALGLINLD